MSHPNNHESFPAFERAYFEHTAKHGKKHWKLLFEVFPDVHEQTKFIWIRKLAKKSPPLELLTDARERLVASVKRFPDTTRAQVMSKKRKLAAGAQDVVDHIPAAPSPAYIAKAGDAGLRNIDFVAEIQSLYRDASLLRAYAMKKKTNPETGEVSEQINNPSFFDRSIARRAALLENAIRAVQEVWDLRTMQNFYETIIDEIGKESPDAQRRIMERLAALNARTGMTLGAMRV